MGDRANVHVYDEYDTSGVYLYTHWNGTELPETVRAALAHQWRWGDAAYLARIIFDEMTAGATDPETGFGISGRVGDGKDRVVHVDCGSQTVRLNDGESMPFAEYVKPERKIRHWHLDE